MRRGSDLLLAEGLPSARAPRCCVVGEGAKGTGLTCALGEVQASEGLDKVGVEIPEVPAGQRIGKLSS